jgi:vitamin B12 transporter
MGRSAGSGTSQKTCQIHFKFIHAFGRKAKKLISMNKQHWAFLLLSVTGTGTIFAQPTFSHPTKDTVTKQLDQVVVTATKYPVKQNLTGKVLDIITREQLDRSEGQQLTQILNEQAGLLVIGAQGTLGSEQDVFMQGAATGKTLILIDGIPAYDPSGTSTNFDLNLINPDEIERVEILKGSQSTLYGSDAVAGVINIIMKKGDGKPFNISLGGSEGTYNTSKASAAIDGKINNTGYNIQYTKLRTDGFSAAYDSTGKAGFDKDGFEESILMANLNQKLSDALQLRGNFQYSQYNNGLDAGAYTDDKKYTAVSKNAQAGLGADYIIHRATLHFNYNYNSTTRSYLDDSAMQIQQGGTFSHSSFTGKSHYAELYTNIDVSKYVNLLAGVDYRNQRTNQYSLFIFQDFLPPFETDYDTSRIGVDSAKVRQAAGYASILLKNLAGFNLELGGRYNSFNRYGNVFTYSINPAYVVNDKFKVFANLSSGFSAPTLYQLYSPYRDPFGALKPEKTVSVETGLQYSVNNFNARALYFDRNTTNQIEFYTDASFNSYYINLDKQYAHGIEIESSWKTGRWSFSGNYTFTTGKVTTPVNGKDTTYNDLYRQPKNLVNLKAGLQATPELFFSVALRTVGSRIEAVYGSTPISIASYYTLSGYAEYKMAKSWKFFINLQNLTNQLYFDIPGYNTARFNFMAGINVHL